MHHDIAEREYACVHTHIEHTHTKRGRERDERERERGERTNDEIFHREFVVDFAKHLDLLLTWANCGLIPWLPVFQTM